MPKLTRVVLAATLLLQSLIVDVQTQAANSSQLTTVYESLNSLEKATFGKSYSNDVLPTRLERLEKKLLGGKQTGGIKSRIDNLLLAAPEESIVPLSGASPSKATGKSQASSEPVSSFNTVIPKPVIIPPSDPNRLVLPLPIRQNSTTVLQQSAPVPSRSNSTNARDQAKPDLKLPMPVTTFRPSVSTASPLATPSAAVVSTKPRTEATNSQVSSQPTLLNNEGVRLINAQKYDEAIQKFETALSIDPDYKMAKENLGIAYNNGALVYQNEPEKAIVYFHKAAYLNPNHETTVKNLASIIMKLGKDPKDFNVRVQLGDKARMQSDLAGAIVEYIAAIKIKPDASVYKRLGDVYRVKDRISEALASYQEGSKLADSAILEVGIGNCQLALRDIASAIAAFQKAVALKPSDRDVQDSLLLGWEAAVQDKPSVPENHIGLGQAYRLKGDRDKAKAEFTQAKNLSPGKVNATADQLLSELEGTNTLASSTPNNSGYQAATSLQDKGFVSSTSNPTISAQQGVDYGTYTADLQRRIKRALFSIRRNETRNGKFIFKVHKDGQMTNLRMTVSSGLALADQAFLKAIENAAPFRPLPSNAPESVDWEATCSGTGDAIVLMSATSSQTSIAAPSQIGYSSDKKNLMFEPGVKTGANPKKVEDSIDYAPFMAKLQKSLKRNWYPPKGEESKRVEVVFKVWRDGRISNYRILTSSGKTGVDQAALKAIENTSGTLSLPDGAPKDIDVQFTFDYNVFHPAKTEPSISKANVSRTPKADWYRKYGQEEPQAVSNLIDFDVFYKNYSEAVRNIVAEFYTQSDYDYESLHYGDKTCKAQICIDRIGQLRSIKFSDGADSILQKLATTAIQRSVPFKPIPQDVGEFVFLELKFRQPVPSDRRYAGISQETYVKISNQYPNCYDIGTTTKFTDRAWRSIVGVGQRVVAGQAVLRAVEPDNGYSGFEDYSVDSRPNYDELKTPVSGTVVSNCTFEKNTNSFNQPYLVLSGVDSNAIAALSSAVEYNKAQLEVSCDYESALSQMLDLSRLSDYWSHRPQGSSAQSKVIIAMQINENGELDNTAENPIYVVYSSQNDSLDDFAKQCVLDAAPYRLKLPKYASRYFGSVGFVFDSRTGAVALGPVQEINFEPFISDLETRVNANLNSEDLNFLGTVACRLKVSADGKLLERRVTKSVSPSADRAALNAIDNAFPCKSLPPGAPTSKDFDFSVPGKPKPGAFRSF